jgi:uncharacterized protein with ATP-grasp and redox domains
LRSGTLPRHISTADPGSFARRTFTERIPAILQALIDDRIFDQKSRTNLQTLKAEVESQQITNPLHRYAIDTTVFERREIASWRTVFAEYGGHSWLEVPWYVAEAMLYFKLLCATGYYEPAAPTYLCDPFQRTKDEELLDPHGGLHTAREVIRIIDENTGKGRGNQEILHDLIQFSLWGNQIDLSNAEIVERSRGSLLAAGREHLLIDHSEKILQKLALDGQVDFILDNAGTELVCDLLLAATLLRSEKGRRVVMHCKKAPFFVSDAMKKDVERTVQVLCGDRLAADLGRELNQAVRQNRLVFRDHFFWNGPEHFADLPGDLRAQLSQSALVLVKGDANYRRLLSDRKWDSSTDMEAIVGYFPASLAVLRTLKSELIVDMPGHRVKRMAAQDPRWLVNGKWGIIRACL